MLTKEDIKINIIQPKWLECAIPDVRRFLDLLAKDKVPDSIKGWMIVTAVRRLLRCVYGDDLTAAKALLDIALMEHRTNSKAS